MSLLNIISGDFGNVIELTFIDVDTGLPANISGYTTTKSMLFVSPAGAATTKTAAFKTTGADGIIKYTVDSAFLTAGNWQVRGQVSTASAKLSTVWHYFTVEA